MINKQPLELIATAIQELTLARDLGSLMFIIRSVARKLTNADGVTFVLKDKDQCYYADEDAISPLWKGQRFPAESCISGWAIMNREAVYIKDIYKDNRIPHDVYKPTFVKSLAMIPIRSVDPVGAIGCYWKEDYLPDESEKKYLTTLADMCAVTYEKLQLYNYIKERFGNQLVDSHLTADILFSPQKFISKLERLL